MTSKSASKAVSYHHSFLNSVIDAAHRRLNPRPTNGHLRLAIAAGLIATTDKNSVLQRIRDCGLAA